MNSFPEELAKLIGPTKTRIKNSTKTKTLLNIAVQETDSLERLQAGEKFKMVNGKIPKMKRGKIYNPSR